MEYHSVDSFNHYSILGRSYGKDGYGSDKHKNLKSGF